MNLAAVSIQELTKKFRVSLRKPPLVALQSLNLTVAAGEIYGLLGPNGSGKSTALKILLGFLSPTLGSTYIFGRQSWRPASREKVGFLPERPQFCKFLTAEEILRFSGQICGMSGRALRERIDALLYWVGMEESRHQRVEHYSQGMLQRIGLAQALIHSPQLVILDEPTAGMDLWGVKQITHLMKELQKQGIAILFTSHLLEQVQEVCDRVGILWKGQLVCEGPLEELVTVWDQLELLVDHEGLADHILQAQIAECLRSVGAQLVSAKPRKRSLEEIFLQATREKKR